MRLSVLEDTEQENLKPKQVLPALFHQLYQDHLDLLYKLALVLTGNADLPLFLFCISRLWRVTSSRCTC